MLYKGSCHCGNVKFEAEGDIEGLVACNCSICQRKGALMWFIPRTSLKLLTREEDQASYVFNKHVIKHRFCPKCGIHTYGEGTAPNGSEMAAVNARVLEDIELDAYPVQHYDGRKL
ncbi:GFA family protein [Pseudoduganella sp. R-32]|uniref:GFA family protein n=1 Tax=unclassified Pseudoduganella TaxID=2637179 RepID=UPI003CF5E8DC